MMPKSYSSPKVEMRESTISGRGLFAKEKILKDELIVDYTYGKGKYISMAVADDMFVKGNDHMIQIGDDEFFCATTENEMENEDHINHSCDPNCGIKGSLQIVAMRNIDPGEEVTFDYAISESSNYQIQCRCGSAKCRKLITGNDWKIPELQIRYKGYFSEYLQKKIT